MSAIKALAIETVTVVVEKKVDLPKNPYFLAKRRIEDAEKKGRDPLEATILRLSRCTRPAKIGGIFWAAKDRGWMDVARDAKEKYRSICGHGSL